MNQPNTIFDILVMLADYHRQRAAQYEKLGVASEDPRAKILLERLVELETQSMKVIQSEMQHITPDHSTYLLSGPKLSVAALHASECCCAGEPNFQETLACALTSDGRVDELLDRIEDCSAAPSVLELAQRLRELEHTKVLQIAKFTRED
ncbi:hypothetical protein [Aureliella helgolandensis]|uniref:DUF2383 domain-containing protein n=1 Tax=Aureliella helgolandensis TaxID=2527968 RepID=A0A518G7P7_9BACT|nr:hypothetical protein [Aureliella helgolandensis]QDV24610.1 hypothetical protein Q31a_29300 [Aureliella helgolandensis]